MAKKNDLWEPVGTVYRKKDSGGGWIVGVIAFFVFFMIIGAIT